MSFDNDAFTEVQSAEDRALTFELGGHEVGWLADGLAIERAKSQGHELGEILSQLSALDDIESAETMEDAANGFAGMYPAVARLCWLGMIRFNKDVTQEAILSVIDLDAIEEIPIGEMMDRIFPSEDEETPEGDSEGK